jgi:hypothetical protein
MKKKTTAKPIVSYEQMDLEQLINSAALANASITAGIKDLGAIIFEISCRYNREGVDLACETLGLSKALAGRFIAVHRGVLHPDIALGTVPFSNRLEKLTFIDQKDIMKNGIIYLEKVGRTVRTKRLPVAQLDSTQVAQLFDGPRLRNEAEQHQYLKDMAKSTNPTKARINIKTWEIKNNKLVVNKPLIFSKLDLTKIIKRLK